MDVLFQFKTGFEPIEENSALQGELEEAQVRKQTAICLNSFMYSFLTLVTVSVNRDIRATAKATMADISVDNTVEDRIVTIALNEASPVDAANDVIGNDNKQKKEKALAFINLNSFL